MKMPIVVCLTACLALPVSAWARGGMGSHSMSISGGGAFGTSAAAPGTNSLGTALSSSDAGGHAMQRPSPGTDMAIDKEDERLDKLLDGSICRGC